MSIFGRLKPIKGPTAYNGLPMIMSNPPPMPDVYPTRAPMRDALAAVERGCQAWNTSDLRNEIAYARTLLDEAERRIRPRAVPPAQQKPQDTHLVQHPCG